MPLPVCLTADAAVLEDIWKRSFAGFTLEKLLSAVILTAVCLIAVKLLLMAADRTLGRMTIEPTLKKLLRVSLKTLLLFIVIILIMGHLNIPVTSLVAVLSVAGLAFSLALQNFLSNIAGGLQLLATKPFKPGDYVEAGGCAGVVVETGLAYTTLTTPDNKLVQLPNSAIVAASITNHTCQPTRRIDVKVSASYDAPTQKVLAVLNQLVKDSPLLLSDPEPMIHVNSYGDNAIEYVILVWCAGTDYWAAYFALLDSIKPAFDAAEVEMTYPHLNVHMIEPEEGAKRS